MARKVTCRACGKKIDITSAFKATSRTYYCSEQEYLIEKALLDIIYEIIGQTKNTILFAEMRLWGDHNKVYNYLKENKTKIQQDISKEFVSEYAKIRYFSALIKNRIADYAPSQPEIIKQTSDEIYDCKYKPKERRKCLQDYYEELVGDGEI